MRNHRSFFTSWSARAFFTIFLIALLLCGCAPIAQEQIVHVAGPPVESYPADVSLAWCKLLLRLVQITPGFSPPVAARAMGYTGVTLYEALAPGMTGYRSLAGLLNELPPTPAPEAGTIYHWPTVANSSLAAIMRHLFPAITPDAQVEINALEQRLASQLRAETTPDVYERSVARGRAVAGAIFEWSKSDGGHEGYLHNFDSVYQPAGSPGAWQPTPPRFAPPMQPHWGQARPFLLQPGQECIAPPPPAYSTDPDSQFYREGREVYDIVRRATPEQREIAQFWSDDPGLTPTPPGHSLSIGLQVLQRSNKDLAFAAELFARLGIALADSFIACWETKYTHNLLRPITYIQQVIDPYWNTPQVTDPVVTPPFPEYTSGHSVEARAAAEVLTQMFGDNYRFTDVSVVDRGLAPRTFDSFYAYAAEAAISRLYGGIHFRSAIKEGLLQGACVGRRVMDLSLRTP
jgi:hypothetical protein